MCNCFTVATAWVYLSLNVPGTYEFTRDSWQNKSWGFYDIDRTTDHGIVWIAPDGSRATKLAHRSYSKYFFLKDTWSFDTVYRAAEHTAFIVDPHAQEIGVISCVDPRDNRSCLPIGRNSADDSKCSQTAEVAIKGGRFIGFGNTGTIGTARYRFNCGPLTINGRTFHYTHEESFAPELGCALVESKHVDYSSCWPPDGL